MVHLISAVIREIKGSNHQTLRNVLITQNDNEIGRGSIK
jgi:hypothetical protein